MADSPRSSPPTRASRYLLGLGTGAEMSIRWDALLARHTAGELNESLTGARLRALRLDGASRDLALLFRDRTLVWRLHPHRGYLEIRSPLDPVEGDLRLRCSLLRVEAPPDERLIRFEFSQASGGRPPLALVVELMGNQWNAMVTEGDASVIRHVLWRRDGHRAQRVGQEYRPPRPLGRAGADGDVTLEKWLETLQPVPPEERPGMLVRAFAWTSPLNAPALLGGPAEPGASSGLEVGFGRWKRMVQGTASPEPVVLHLPAGAQPYPFPLPGTPYHATETLLAAFAACAADDSGSADTPLAAALGPALVRRLEQAERRAARRLTRLEMEQANQDDPAALRRIGDLILSRYADVPAGASQVRLTGFDGESVEVRLDPSEPAHANAERYYRDATKADRARERLPRLLEDARADRAGLEELLARARVGTVTEEQVGGALGPASPTGCGQDALPSLPYRVFTSSGGLEIRVGRGARHNDDLTFRHSSPNDVWLHARHSSGAHVILRWAGTEKPPARDLEEAATLAALHSKARTSGSVPVDWTRRKYVRKPRKAPPGRVAAERVQTLFVEPDPDLPSALAAAGDATKEARPGRPSPP